MSAANDSFIQAIMTTATVPKEFKLNWIEV